MNKIKKFFTSLAGVITAIGIFLLTGWALFKQIMTNKANKEEINRLRSGLNDVSVKNEKIIKETVKNIEVNEKIINKTKDKLAKMSLKEKVKFAKDLGY